MKIAVIPAFNEEFTIGAIVSRALFAVDRVIVVDDSSTDRTAEAASRAGAAVIRNAKNLGRATTLSVGLAGAQELNPEYIVEMDGDGNHNPREIPNLLLPLLENQADIVIAKQAPEFIAYSSKALSLMSRPRLEAGMTDALMMEAKSRGLRIEYRPVEIEPIDLYSSSREMRDYFSQMLEEHAIDRINRFSSLKEIYDERRNVQRVISNQESYRLVSETLLKFIPPALLSLVISLLVLAPSTGFDLDAKTAVAVIISVVAVFFMSWSVLTRIIAKIHEKQDYLEALGLREAEVRQEQREKSGYSKR